MQKRETTVYRAEITIFSLTIDSIYNIDQLIVLKRTLEAQRERAKREFWVNLSGIEFEQELGKVFIKQGYEVEWTPISGDEGIDLILKRNSKTIIVQCKAHKYPASLAMVRELYGALISCKADEAILASIGGFTEGVKTFWT